MIQCFGLLKHLLRESPSIAPRHGDAADEVETPRLDRPSQLQRVAGSHDVRPLELSGFGRKVIQRAQVEEVADLAGELPALSIRDAEQVMNEIALDRSDQDGTLSASA